MIDKLNAELEAELKGSRKSIRQVCEELGIDIPEHVNLVQCSHCSVWAKTLREDLDGNPICGVCLTFYGE